MRTNASGSNWSLQSLYIDPEIRRWVTLSHQPGRGTGCPQGAATRFRKRRFKSASDRSFDLRASDLCLDSFCRAQENTPSLGQLLSYLFTTERLAHVPTRLANLSASCVHHIFRCAADSSSRLDHAECGRRSRAHLSGRESFITRRPYAASARKPDRGTEDLVCEPNGHTRSDYRPQLSRPAKLKSRQASSSASSRSKTRIA